VPAVTTLDVRLDNIVFNTTFDQLSDNEVLGGGGYDMFLIVRTE